MASKLSKYQPGQSGRVVQISEGQLRAKLVEMGLYTGKQVKVLFKAPLGDPIAVDIEGYVLSLRMDEADMVLLDPLTA